ncbi:immunoglobulin domain-containing protein isoform X2 [Osmerus eperlanus]|uniref:immunoglobulin domain-containing protein isoform X2 n=1 Tax=Osmerus eperlanus TaxID=29151 RepID=UPI002E11285A
MTKQTSSGPTTGMRRGPVLSRFILLCTVTGLASCDVQVSYRRERGVLEVTCCLRGDPNATLTQVNWVFNRGPSNQSNLGVFHPDHGAHVPPEYVDRVGVQGSVADRSSTLRLLGGAVEEEEGGVCCVFNAFPVGVLEGCADTVAMAAAQEGDLSEEAQIREVERWALLIGGALLCFLSITTSIYLLCKNCYRHCCRRKVFEVHTCLSDLHAQSEDILVESPAGSHPCPPLPPAPPQPRGFDPSKLYAKIKLDLLYGRLWRSYQGTSRARTMDPPGPPGPQQPPSPPQAHPEQVYSVLAQPRPLTQEEVTEPSLEERSDVTSEPTTSEQAQGSEVTTSSSAKHPEEQHACDDVTMT